MPGASRRAVTAGAADPRGLEILDNTAGRQAAAVPSLGLTAANFRQPGTVGTLASALTSTLGRTRSGVTTRCVSEPPHSGQPELGRDRPGQRVIGRDPSGGAAAAGSALRLRSPPGAAGATPRRQVAIG
ncbi:polysaccharide lyase beta-sandwich domain-containing protein [Streptomyces sp. NPDC001970]